MNDAELVTLLQQIDSAYGAGGSGITTLGQQPDGDWVAEKADGAAIQTEDLLTADETFTSEWVDTDGWGSLEIVIISDRPSATDGLVVEFTDNVQEDTVVAEGDRKFTYAQADIDAGTSLRVIIPTQLDGLRLKYTNGDTGQNTFLLVGTLRRDRISETSSLAANVESETLSQIVRGVLAQEDDSGAYGRLRRVNDALKTSISEQEIPVEKQSHADWQVDQVTISSDQAEQLDENALANRKIIEVTNEGTNDQPIYIAESEARATETSGYPIDQGEHKELELTEDADVWAILDSDASGSTQEQTLSANNTISSSGVTNPDNAFSSDDSDATFDTQGDTAEYGLADFSFSTGFDTIENVDMRFEGAEGSADLQTIAHEETETAIQEGGTAITTDENLTANGEHFYLAFIAFRPDAVQVDSVTGLGLSWSERTVEVNATGNIRVACWSATGTPDSDSSVTANFDSEVNSAAIAVSRWSGVDVDGTPVDATDIDSGSTAAWDVTPSGTDSGDRIIGGAAIAAETTNDPGGDDTEHSDQSLGGGSATRLTLATQSREAGSADEPTDGTWADTGQWAAAAIALNQDEEPPPEMTMEYEVGSEGAGPTTLSATLDNTSDETFTEDITGDRTWTDTDLDNTKLTLTLDNADARDADIDHVFLVVTEAESTGVQTIGIIEEAI